MAFSSILRRSASSFAPLAARALRSQQNCHSAIFTALNQTRIVSSEPRLSPFPPPARSYSTKRPSSDENLLRVLDSEIQCAKETVDRDRVEEAPGGFPFEIEDKPGLNIITLSREYPGEQIKVEVSMPESEGVTSDDNQDYNDDEGEYITVKVSMPDLMPGEDGDDDKSSIHLVVTLYMENGKGYWLIEFDCTAYPDEIVIDLLTNSFSDSEDEILFERLNFRNLDENLQKALHKYLEVRGIKPSTTNFLLEYMINKERRENLMLLKNLKKFLEA